jgi:hypothetical protein
MRFLLRRGLCLTGFVMGSMTITSCNVLDMSDLGEAFSSNLKSISVSSGGIVEVGDTVRLDASGSVSGLIGIFSYAPILDAEWSVSDPLIARLIAVPPPPPEDSFPRAHVLVRGLQPGKVTVFAQSHGIRGSAEVRVIPRIDHIDIRASRDTLFVGDTLPIITTVVGANGLPITDIPLSFEASGGVQVIWYSAPARAIAIASGPATVTARFRNAAGTVNLTVLSH